MIYRTRTLTEFMIRGIVHVVSLAMWYVVAPTIYTALGSYIIVALGLGGYIIWNTQQTIRILDYVFDYSRGH